MNYKKFSIAELSSLVQNYNLLSLPNTTRGIQYRADKEDWEFEEVPTQGGKNGMKKVYVLPEYLIRELMEQGLLHLLTDDEPTSESVNPFRSYLKQRTHSATSDVPAFMREMVAEYDDWAAEQDISLIVPVRYHANIFGSAGNGYEVLEQVNTEAMWFRASFFDVLGVPPERCFCTRIKGDSMHPTLTDRGTAMWQMMSRYTGTDIYLFRQVNELRIKRLQQINSFTFNVISDNSNKDIYPTETLDLREMEEHEFEIYGRYLWDCSIKS